MTKMASRLALCVLLFFGSSSFAASRSSVFWQRVTCGAVLLAGGVWWWDSTAPPWKAGEPTISESRYDQAFEKRFPRPSVAGYGTKHHTPPARLMATLERWDAKLAQQLRRNVEATVIAVEWKGEIAGIVSLARVTDGDDALPTKRHHDVVLQRVLLGEWLDDSERQAVAVSLLMAAQSHVTSQSDAQTLWVRIDREWRYDMASTEAIFLSGFRYVAKEENGEEIWRYTRNFEARRDAPAQLRVLFWDQSGTREAKKVDGPQLVEIAK